MLDTLKLIALRVFPWPIWLFLVVSAVASLAVLTWPLPQSDRETRLCDRMVDALLHSKDLVEVTRAGIIVHEINCGFWRRLDDDGR